MTNRSKAADIYERQEMGGDVQQDIAGMSIADMEDYFMDADPAEFL